MKSTIKKILLTALVLSGNYVFAQEITQTVKGQVIDRVNHLPLSKASVQVTQGTAQYGSQTDDNGHFAVAIPVGRYKIRISYTGYTTFEDELLVIAGREAVVNVSLDATAKTLEEVEIGGAAIEDVPGQRSLTIEKTLRVPANFFDPVRVATAYPGVVAANDQNNAIVVRGNSPNGLLWRLNGLDIVNPNHLSNAGTLSDRPAANGGGVNILSAQMLDRTDFYMGAVPADYGNVLSGVIDMKLREGNKSKMEYTAQASLIGLDVAAEGPLNKNGNTSFLANYRYSTVGLLSQIGVDFGGEAITFQDLSLHLNRKGKRGVELSVFGFYGSSKNDFDARTEEEWKEEKDLFDILYKSTTYAAGMNYTVPLPSGKIFAGLAYSSGRQKRDASLSHEAIPPGFGDDPYLLNRYKLLSGLLSLQVVYQRSVGKKNTWDIGVTANHVSNDLITFREVGCLQCTPFRMQIVDGKNEGFLLQPVTNVMLSVSPAFTLNAGLRYVAYTYNHAGALEPRMNLILKTSGSSDITIAYSLVSQVQLPQVYAATGNKDLGLTRSHHFDIDYKKSLSTDFDLKAGVFYQHLFDVPVGTGNDEAFSTINLMEGAAPDNLVNAGTGANYGIDAILEKHFYSLHYFTIGGSYYESTYKASDGIRRNTRFNGNYTVNATYGKEWGKAEKNRTIGLNTRLLYLGGLRESAIIGPSITGETAYADWNPYTEKLKDYFRLDLRLSFRKNKPGYTRTFAIDIQNLTAQQNEAYHYYDHVQQKAVTKYQLGIIPVLVYRIDF